MWSKTAIYSCDLGGPKMGQNIDTYFENRGFNSWHDKKNEKILKILFLGEVGFGVEFDSPL